MSKEPKRVHVSNAWADRKANTLSYGMINALLGLVTTRAASTRRTVVIAAQLATSTRLTAEQFAIAAYLLQ